MAFADFLRSLLEEGSVTVSRPGVISDSEIEEGVAELSDFESRYRLEIPGNAPPLELPAARWAAVTFHRACQFVVYRDIDSSTIQQQLPSTYGAPATAQVHYSVDLVFRFLPDLLVHARQLSRDDPLVTQLMALARAWPLSSVGVNDVVDVAIDGFADCPSLLALYVDRVLATSDTKRLRDPRVAQAVQAAVGAYPKLAGRIAAQLQVPDKLARWEIS